VNFDFAVSWPGFALHAFVGLTAIDLISCTPAPPEIAVLCPAGSAFEGDRCVATAVIPSASASAAASSTRPPFRRVSPPPTPAEPLAAAVDADGAALLGVTIMDCWHSLFVYVRRSADAPTTPDVVTDAAELRRAIARGDPAVHRCIGGNGFIPLQRDEYRVIIGVNGDVGPSGFPGTVFGQEVEVGARDARVYVTGYRFGGNTHCPFAAFVDQPSGPAAASRVLLDGRASAARAGTDRVRFHDVRIHQGRVAIRVYELDDELTHLDRLGLEIDGVALVAESEGSLQPLAHEDGRFVDIPNGRQLIASFRVPNLDDATVDVDVVASGYYLPIEP
jgi:hypothetical protein